jgi:hypothetical protein
MPINASSCPRAHAARYLASHGQLLPNPVKEGLPTIRPESRLADYLKLQLPPCWSLFIGLTVRKWQYAAFAAQKALC